MDQNNIDVQVKNFLDKLKYYDLIDLFHDFNNSLKFIFNKRFGDPKQFDDSEELGEYVFDCFYHLLHQHKKYNELIKHMDDTDIPIASVVLINELNI